MSSNSEATADTPGDTAFPISQLFSCTLIEPDLWNGGRKHRAYFFSSEEGALKYKANFVKGWLEFLVPDEDDYHANHGYSSGDEDKDEDEDEDEEGTDEPKTKKPKYEVRHDPSSWEFFGTTNDGDRIQAIVEEVKVNKDASGAKPLFSLTTSF
uniref:Uncharacterized protein n=1 Tax=Spumella elongata TaxID=89044 RepID=A0A7S3HFQ7_9STRA|mmetsp:Transcript_5045/g.8545  ORF Transcript_5045/g.8545 Transcript_5045/m.8545 type:complete len:154 (+) Transcript_5045:85-546(+)